jgi:hypothetical protein
MLSSFIYLFFFEKPSFIYPRYRFPFLHQWFKGGQRRVQSLLAVHIKSVTINRKGLKKPWLFQRKMNRIKARLISPNNSPTHPHIYMCIYIYNAMAALPTCWSIYKHNSNASLHDGKEKKIEIYASFAVYRGPPGWCRGRGHATRGSGARCLVSGTWWTQLCCSLADC